MNKYRKRRRNRFLKFVFVMLLVAGSIYYAPEIWQKYNHFDGNKILANSSLKKRTFNAKIKKINVDGVSAYFMEEHSNPLISIDFIFQNVGTAHEPENKQGLVNLLTLMLDNGAEKYDAEKFKNLKAEYGINIDFTANQDDIQGSISSPKQNLSIAVSLFKAVMTAPHFKDEYLLLNQQQMLKALQLHQQHPQNILQDKFNEVIFAGHPYSRQDIGKSQHIISIKTEDLRNYMNNHLAKNNLIIGIAGDLNKGEAEKLLSDLFSYLPAEAMKQELPRLNLETSGVFTIIPRDSAQNIAQFIAPGTYRDSVDFYPLYMANYIFGGSGLNSRLSKVIREKNGLTYGIYTYLSINDASASLEGSFSATPENFSQAISLLQDEWHKIASGDISAAELEQAKNSLLASHNLRFASIGNISSILVDMQKYQLGIDFLNKRNDYIRAINLNEVNAAAKKYFKNKPDFVVIGTEFEEK